MQRFKIDLLKYFFDFKQDFMSIPDLDELYRTVHEIENVSKYVFKEMVSHFFYILTDDIPGYLRKIQYLEDLDQDLYRCVPDRYQGNIRNLILKYGYLIGMDIDTALNPEKAAIDYLLETATYDYALVIKIPRSNDGFNIIS